MKTYSYEELQTMDRRADIAIKTMTTASIGVGFAPVFIDITALMAGIGVGVVAIGKCYAFELTKEEAGELVIQFFKTAGLIYTMIAAGQKLAASFLKSNPLTYLPTMISDAAMCGAVAFAIGNTSKHYFRHRAEGKIVDASDIRRWMKEGKAEGQSLARREAENRAQHYTA